MCGPSSAIGLDDHERELWPVLRERLRVPGHSMAMMRGILGGDAEVGVIAAVTPGGLSHPLAILVTPGIAAEVGVVDPEGDTRRALVGDNEVVVLMDAAGHRPIAVLVNDWIRAHLTVYARELWHRRGSNRA